MSLDFMKVHPRTERWWKEREQCKQCKHYSERKTTGLKAMLSPLQACLVQPHFRRIYPWACIEMRDEGAPCGPEGLLFEAKE